MDASRITPADIAEVLDLNEAELWYLARTVETNYLPTRKKRIGKKTREIDEPKPKLKRLLRKLHRWLQSCVSIHPSSHGGVKGRSCFTSAESHLGRKFVFSRDIANCYPSITTDRMRERLEAFGFPKTTARLLSLFFTLNDRIPQGCPVSSDALNLFLYDMDNVIGSVCAHIHASYSRVYDDVVVGLDSREAASDIQSVVEGQIQSHGLKVNQGKMRQRGLQACNRPQLVHNIVVNSPKGTGIADSQRVKFLALAEGYVRGCLCVGPDSLEGLAKKRERLMGCICHCGQAAFGPKDHLRRLMRRGDAIVLQRLSRERLTAPKNKWWVIRSTKNEPRRLGALWKRRCNSQSIQFYPIHNTSLQTVSA